MRTAFVAALIAVLALPLFAHDDISGFMNCYGGKHCPQNTLVFGKITSAEAKTFNLEIQKVLIGKATEGSTVTLNNTGWRSPVGGKRPPAVNDFIVVSYLQTAGKTLRPHYLIRSKNSSLDAFSAADIDRYTGNTAIIEHFVQSEGKDTTFSSSKGSVFLHKKDAKPEQIYPVPLRSASARPHDKPAKARAAGKSSPNTLYLILAAALFAGGAVWVIIRKARE